MREAIVAEVRRLPPVKNPDGFSTPWQVRLRGDRRWRRVHLSASHLCDRLWIKHEGLAKHSETARKPRNGDEFVDLCAVRRLGERLAAKEGS